MSFTPKSAGKPQKQVPAVAQVTTERCRTAFLTLDPTDPTIGRGTPLVAPERGSRIAACGGKGGQQTAHGACLLQKSGRHTECGCYRRADGTRSAARG
jgi:hypothetical protein